MAAGNSKTREALQLWRDHLELDDEEFREFLQRFKILSGLGSLDQVLEHCSDRMRAVGLKGNEATIRVGIAIVRDLIGDGVRELDRHALCKLINRYELPKERPVATLLIQEIDHRPHAQLATASVDWVEEFYGDSPDERRRPKDATCWDERFLPDLRAAIHRIRDARFQAIRLDGAFRLPTAFTLGRELNERTGVEVLISASMNEEWSTAEDPPGTVSLESEMIQIGEATGLAVALSISGDIGANVKEHLIKAAPETAGRLLVLKPQSGCGRHAVAGAGQARAMAEEIVDELRSLVHDEEIHLFLSCPKPLAVVLGHVWNRLPAGWVYADLNPGYARSYRISST